MIDALLKRLFALNVSVSEKEVINYYKKHKNEYNKPFKNVKKEIYNLILRQKEREFFEQYLKKLRESAKIEINTKLIQNLN